MNEKERLLVRVRAHNWFIFSKDDGFLVVPAYVKKKENSWYIPYDTSVNHDVLVVPPKLIGKEYPIMSNCYIKDYKLAQDFESEGYKTCGLCRGEEIEEKHPIIDTLLKLNKNIYKLDEDIIIQTLAVGYSAKITEQYENFVSKKKSVGKPVNLDRFGVPF